MRFKGTVKRERIRIGSKSEQEAMMLVTAAGKHYKLRRPGAHAFHDEVLLALEGKEISGNGEVADGQLFLSEWKVTDET